MELGEIGIVGSGSWGTAIAKIILGKAESLHWCLRHKEDIAAFMRLGHNPKYLTDMPLPVERISFSADINETAANCKTLVFATPSPFLVNLLKKLKTPLTDKFVVTAIKGIVSENNLVCSEYFRKQMRVPEDHIAVLSGPSHAEEVALGRLTYLTVGCTNQEKAQALAELLEGGAVRTKTSTDVIGIEYAAVLKNVYAIAAGICLSLGYGDNFLSVLLANAGKEMNRFLRTAYPVDRSICDSVYLGDLLVTSYSTFSRNRVFGSMIGKGYSVKNAQMEMSMVAEGYYGTRCIRELNHHFQVNMPVMNAVYNILYAGIPAKLEIQLLSETLR